MIAADIIPQAPAGFRAREATLADAEELAGLWFGAFNDSHKFWAVVTPDDRPTRQWFTDLWASGVTTGSDVFKTWVMEDLSNGRLAAFARWCVPRADGTQECPLPAYPKEWDPELTVALWDGMAVSRAAVMGKRPHWSECIPSLNTVGIFANVFCSAGASWSRSRVSRQRSWFRSGGLGLSPG